MSSRHAETRPPLIPQPPTTRDALREAVRQIALARLPEFDRDLGEAFDQAIQLSSPTPLRLFLEKWATLVAILRNPERARRLQEAERALADPGISDEAFRAARETVAGVLDAASREVLGEVAR